MFNQIAIVDVEHSRRDIMLYIMNNFPDTCSAFAIHSTVIVNCCCEETIIVLKLKYGEYMIGPYKWDNSAVAKSVNKQLKREIHEYYN